MKPTRSRVFAIVLTVMTVLATLAAPAAAHSREVFLDSTIALDSRAGQITLPLFRGRHDGRNVWYIVTESSDEDDAEGRGVNHAEKLENALGTRAVQSAHVRSNGVLHFAGTVDFSPTRVVVPGPDGFPPASFQAGAVGDAAYSPLVTTDGRTVLNASHVANRSGLHDAVVSISFARRQVTLDLFDGFYEGNRVQYLHQEGSTALIAALEGSTLAPNLDAAPGVGSNDKDDSARSAIIPIVNGPRGVDNPERQGLESALLGQGDPLNITQEVPGDNEYSPVWDITPALWTDEAIARGQRQRLTDADDVADAFEDGDVVSAGMGPRNDELEGLRALPAISNCPVVVEFD